MIIDRLRKSIKRLFVSLGLAKRRPSRKLVGGFCLKGRSLKKGVIEKNSFEIGKGVIFSGENYLNMSGSTNKIKIGDGAKINGLDIRIYGEGNTLVFGENTRWTGRIIIVGKNRTISIGSRTTAQGCYILSRDADVHIGEDCMISREIEIRATDVHKIYDLETGERLNFPKRDISIGNRVWIGAKVMVSKNTIIPDGCIVGACSFVSKAFDVKNCIIAGSPAKMIKEDIYWER